MTVEALFADVLNNLSAAQFESYKFSQELGRNDYLMLPVPTAEIREVTLNINYAYERNENPEPVQRYDATALFAHLQDILKTAFMQAQRDFVAQLDLGETDEIKTWPEIRKNILAGKLTGSLIDNIRPQATGGLDRVFNQQAEISRHGLAAVNLLAPLMESALLRLVAGHPDLEAIVKAARPDRNEFQKKIREELIRQLPTIDRAVTGSLTQSPQGLNIVVDAEKLKTLPSSAIQHAQVTVKMRNLFVEKNEREEE